MFGKLVAFLLITVASARDLYLFNKLDRDIIVSITGKSDVSLGVGTKVNKFLHRFRLYITQYFFRKLCLYQKNSKVESLPKMPTARVKFVTVL